MLLLSLFSIAQNNTSCFELLKRAFDKYDFVTTPLPKGKMFHLQTTTIAEIDPSKTNGPSKITLNSSVYLSNTRNVMISNEVEIYSSPVCLIQILPKEKLIFIYDANTDSIKRWQIDQLLHAKKQILESLTNAPCITLNDSLINYEMDEKLNADYPNHKSLTLNSKTGYMQHYVIRFTGMESLYRCMDTKYTYSAVENENELMKSDFLRMIYTSKNEVKPVYQSYQIRDIRIHKNIIP
jgi:hypothetical protein